MDGAEVDYSVPMYDRPTMTHFIPTGDTIVTIVQDDLDWNMEMAKRKLELIKKYNFKSRERGEALRNEHKKLLDTYHGFNADTAFARYGEWWDWRARQRSIDDPYVDYHPTLDVHGYEVRSTHWKYGVLMIKPEYELPLKANSPFVLVVMEDTMRFRIAGWVWGKEGPLCCPVPYSPHPKFPVTYNVKQIRLRKFV